MNAKHHGKLFLFVDVYFIHVDFSCIIFCNLVNRGRHSAAWAAPCGKEVDYGRVFALKPPFVGVLLKVYHFFLEFGSRQKYHLSGRSVGRSGGGFLGFCLCGLCAGLAFVL